jgi:hypothetical protein
MRLSNGANSGDLEAEWRSRSAGLEQLIRRFTRWPIAFQGERWPSRHRSPRKVIPADARGSPKEAPVGAQPACSNPRKKQLAAWSLLIILGGGVGSPAGAAPSASIGTMLLILTSAMVYLSQMALRLFALQL